MDVNIVKETGDMRKLKINKNNTNGRLTVKK